MTVATTIEVFRKNDLVFNLTFKDSNGDVIDITGYTVFMTVKADPLDSDDVAILSETVTSHSDPTNGATTIDLSKTDLNVSAEDYYYDVQTKDGSGNITTWGVGTFSVLQNITERTS